MKWIFLKLNGSQRRKFKGLSIDQLVRKQFTSFNPSFYLHFTLSISSPPVPLSVSRCSLFCYLTSSDYSKIYF